MYKYVIKILDWGVKLASLAVTGPATWVVASLLFSDVTNPYLLFLMKFAAVFLIEGVLLSNWMLLEFDKKAAPEVKARYGFTALGMYVALMIIAWAHEGPVGLVFRFALFAALVGSGWDTYVYTWRKMTESVDRDVANSWSVRRYARGLSVSEAKLKRKVDHELVRARELSRARVGEYENELREDLNTERTKLLHERLLTFVDESVVDVMNEALDQIVSGTSIFKPYRQLPDEVSVITKQVIEVQPVTVPIHIPAQTQTEATEPTSGEFRELPGNSANGAVEAADVDPKLHSRWESIYSQLPETFTRHHVQTICGCAKTLAAEFIVYGKRLGDVKEERRGLYVKVRKNAPQLPEVTAVPEGTSTEQLPVVTVHTPGLISTEPTPTANIPSQEDLPLTPEGDVDKFYVIREKLDGTGWEAVCAICTQGVYYGQNRREVSDSIEEHVRSQHTSPADFS